MEADQHHERIKRYWYTNIKVVLGLLSIWFLVSFGFSILWVDALDNFSFFGFKLGFWFAQQGAIFVFVLLIFAYVWIMRRVDQAHDVDE